MEQARCMLENYGYRHTHNTQHLLPLHGNNRCVNAVTLNVRRLPCLNFVAGQNSLRSEEKFIALEKYMQLTHLMGTADGGTVVKVLCYKSEGRWLDSRWCHWNFLLI
jgi:hypothetical protein